MNKKGFTLVELAAVIIVLGIVFGIAYGLLNNHVDEAAEAAFRESVNGILREARIYVEDNDIYDATLELEDLELAHIEDLGGTVEVINGKVRLINITNGDFVLIL